MSIEHPNWTLHEYSWFPVSKCKCRGISFNTMIPRNPFKPSHPPILINDPMSEEYCHFDQDELNAFHNRSVTWDYSKARICYTTDGQSVHSSYLASTIPQSILYIPGFSSLPISPPPPQSPTHSPTSFSHIHSSTHHNPSSFPPSSSQGFPPYTLSFVVRQLSMCNTTLRSEI